MWICRSLAICHIYYLIASSSCKIPFCRVHSVIQIYFVPLSKSVYIIFISIPGKYCVVIMLCLTFIPMNISIVFNKCISGNFPTGVGMLVIYSLIVISYEKKIEKYVPRCTFEQVSPFPKAFLYHLLVSPRGPTRLSHPMGRGAIEGERLQYFWQGVC